MIKGNIHILVVWIIICSITERAEAEKPGISSCTLSGEEGINSNLTIEVIYNGQPHSQTQLSINSFGRGMSNLSCEGLWNSSGFPSYTECNSNYFYIYFKYPISSISTATFIISGLTFPPNPQTYSNFMYIYAWNNDREYGYSKCSSFTSPSYTAQLLGNYPLYIYKYIYIYILFI